MSDEPYQKREIDSFMQNLTEKLEEHHRDILDKLTAQDKVLVRIESDGKETKIQAQKTNGRVTKLEVQLSDYTDVKKAVIANSYWKKYVIAASSVVGGIILAYAGLYITTVNRQKQEFAEMQRDLHSIKSTLINYDFEIVE